VRFAAREREERLDERRTTTRARGERFCSLLTAPPPMPPAPNPGVPAATFGPSCNTANAASSSASCAVRIARAVRSHRTLAARASEAIVAGDGARRPSALFCAGDRVTGWRVTVATGADGFVGDRGGSAGFVFVFVVVVVVFAGDDAAAAGADGRFDWV
jgi:hypothetical protein